jgi:hypothetical protein
MAVARYVRDMDEQAMIVAGIDVGKMWDRYLGETLDKYVELERQGLSADRIEQEMSQFLRQLSSRPVEDLARTTSSVAYNAGRNAEILSAFAGDERNVEWVIRSEVLDTATCDRCGQLDGSAFRIGTDEFYEFAPPAKCEGGARCRGFYIAVGGV